jgi:hypothetical protein
VSRTGDFPCGGFYFFAYQRAIANMGRLVGAGIVSNIDIPRSETIASGTDEKEEN